jgi:hypothetical protein
MKTTIPSSAGGGPRPFAQQSYDLVVYGGTAGGVMTAVSGARQGLKTVLLEPVTMSAAWSAAASRAPMSAAAKSSAAWRSSSTTAPAATTTCDRHLQELAWMPEPKVAEAIMREMLTEAGVTLLERHRLREKTGVRKEGTDHRNHHRKRRPLPRQDLRRYQLRRRPDGSGQGQLHLRPRRCRRSMASPSPASAPSPQPPVRRRYPRAR